MNVLTESCNYQINIGNNNYFNAKNIKLCVERKILIDLIKMHEKVFTQEKLSFENALTNIIESKLRETLGDAVFQAIKNYLEEKFSVKFNGVVEKPEEFFIALEKIFGKSVCTIEKLILKEIQGKAKF